MSEPGSRYVDDLDLSVIDELPVVEPPAGATIYITRPHSVEQHSTFDPLPKDCSSWCWEHGETWYMPTQWKWGIATQAFKRINRKKRS